MNGLQSARHAAASSPLDQGECGCTDGNHPWCDTFVLRRMDGTEELGRMFRYEVEVLSERDDIAFESALGRQMSVRLDVPEHDRRRYFHGFVSRVEQVDRRGHFAVYRITLRPWLWFLTRTSDCRIFPVSLNREEGDTMTFAARQMTVPDLVMELFREHGLTDFDSILNETYKGWEHCVQYRESDFQFVQRMLEHEGIYYYFFHDEQKHELILSDGPLSHPTEPGFEEVPYYPPDNQEARERDHFLEWSISKQVQPGTVTLKDFDFEQPRVDLSVTASPSIQSDHAMSDRAVFDYPGGYLEPADGELETKQSHREQLQEAYEKIARNRIDEKHSRYETLTCRGNVRGLYAGVSFALTDPLDNQLPTWVTHKQRDGAAEAREWVVVKATHRIRSQPHGVGDDGDEEPPYEVEIAAIDADHPFRPRRDTPKPTIQGPQTATVVGDPQGNEEIWTDPYGRVKVRFHWDRHWDRGMEEDEQNACWVRVAQVWAGRGWGAQFIPRRGQEVVVEFLEGDPDRPLITGSVYNGDNAPPYALPDNRTQSGIKTRSSTEGTEENYNEIKFEDKKGEEQLSIHAEKDMSASAENDQSLSAGHDQNLSAGHDQSVTVENDLTERVNNNKTINVEGTHTETIKRDTSVRVDQGMIQISAKKAFYMTSDDEDVAVQSFSKKMHAVGKTEALLSGEQKAKVLSTSGPVEIQGSQKVEIKCGGSTITVDASGVEVVGTNVSVNGSAGVTIDGGTVRINC
jgi:type VI secretion system secreted protein VgrG